MVERAENGRRDGEGDGGQRYEDRDGGDGWGRRRTKRLVEAIEAKRTETIERR